MKYEINGFSFKTEKHYRSPITSDQYGTARSATQVLLDAVAFEERIRLVVDNLYEFECDLLKLAQEHLLWPEHSHNEAMQQRLLLDRRLVNLLTACRLYNDQSAHTISRMCGKDGAEFRALDEEKSRIYDSRFGYRLMEAIRNHVQHRSLAVHSISYSNAVDHPRPTAGKPFVEVAIIPKISFSTLESDEEFNRGVLQECWKLGRDIDLRGPVREYIWSLVELHAFSNRLLEPKIERAITDHKKLSEAFGALLTIKPDWMNLLAIDDSKQEQPFEQLSFDDGPEEYYRHLLKRRVRPSELRLLFASGGRIEPKNLPTNNPHAKPRESKKGAAKAKAKKGRPPETRREGKADEIL